VHASSVDPRDTLWEVDRPTFRVYFWHQQAAPADIPQHVMAYVSDEYRLTEASDVFEVIAWARATARDEQTFTLYVEQDSDVGPGLIRLAGVDPTENP
jgi:hypothetical protein